MTILHEAKPIPKRRVVGWAWLCMALIPAGFALSLVALLAMAAWFGVDLLPDRWSAQRSVIQGLLLGCTSTLIALVAPTAAVILAGRAQRADEPSAKPAWILSIGLLTLTVLAFTLMVSLFGLVGVAVVGVVLYRALHRPSDG